ncbi:MAG: saccharopine dehydrogenase NADP-binding domain-containing protein [Cyclobacteriaceae bacterium]|nr:saccharopine dehydrogenase NADP-binding domain-containing protein [Cyclobacteriaceae bacterium]
MKTILVLGAGRSSSSLISYLLDSAASFGWQIIIGDFSLEAARAKVGASPHGKAIVFDIEQEEQANETIALTDVVISLLPPHLHTVVARHCLALGKHLFTASYVSDEMKAFDEEARKKGLLFLNECGLDPGIDHMSAMQIIDRVKDGGGKIISFESFTGGLIAPETDPENPWRYKFTWNPRNVVMAGQGTAKFIEESQVKYIPYQQLFKRIVQITVPGYGAFEGYANRDSLKYIDTYALDGIETMLRGTLRNYGFCAAWDVLVQSGCCDDTYKMERVSTMTHRDFVNAFLKGSKTEAPEDKLMRQFNLAKDSPELLRLAWSGFFTGEPVGLKEGTPAQILEHILNKKWALQPSDKDMIVMIHRFVARIEGREKTIQSSLVVKGDGSVSTAMAKTVGLPMGMAARLLMLNKLKSRGVVIPTGKEFYEPILEELKEFSVEMVEREG